MLSGNSRTRTCDLLRIRQMLYQLSYVTITRLSESPAPNLSYKGRIGSDPTFIIASNKRSFIQNCYGTKILGISAPHLHTLSNYVVSEVR